MVSEELAKIREEYGTIDSTDSVESKFDADTKEYDSRAGRDYNAGLKRLSSSPRVKNDQETAQLFKTLRTIQVTMAKKNREMGKLDASMANMFKGDNLYSRKENFIIWCYENILRNEDKAAELQIEYSTDSANHFVELMDRYTSIVNENLQMARDREEITLGIQKKSVSHWKHLDKKAVDSLRKGYTARDALTKVDVTLTDLQKKIDTFDEGLQSLEGQVLKARDENDVATVTELTAEMDEILQHKHKVLDEYLKTENLRLDVKTEILGAMDAVKSAKSQLVHTKLTYETISEQREANRKIVIKYENILEDTVPNLKLQAEAAMDAMTAKDMLDFVYELFAVQDALGAATADLAMHANEVASELLLSPLGDVDAAFAKLQEVKAHRAAVEARELEHADKVGSVRSTTGTENFAFHS